MMMGTKMNLPKSMRKLAGPAHQRVWAIPVVLNFILGGAAAGYYILWLISTHYGIEQMPGIAYGGLLAVLLVSAGIAALALESGRPFRARYLLTHWNSSWMSREAAAGMIFIIAAIIDVVSPSSIVATVAAGAACVFLLSQGMLVFRCTAVPVWHDPIIPVLFLSSGLMAGYSLILLNRFGLILPQLKIPPLIDAIALTCIAINGIAWGRVARPRSDHDTQTAVRRLLRPAKMVVVVGFGHVLPAILLLLIRPWSMDNIGAGQSTLIAIVALAILVGNSAQKLWLVRHAQHVCSMRLDGE